jgi:glutaredoxin
MLSFNKTGNQCYFDNQEKKICYATKCNNIYPVSKGWTMYGLSWCPYRKKASDLLAENKIPYLYYDIEQAPFNGKDNFKEMMKNYLNGQATTPAIFHNGRLIGGYSDLQRFF